MSGPDAEKGVPDSAEKDAVRQTLSDHFVMWHELDDIAGPSGEWRCACQKKFGFSDSAIDHVADAIIRVLPPGVGA